MSLERISSPSLNCSNHTFYCNSSVVKAALRTLPLSNVLAPNLRLWNELCKDYTEKSKNAGITSKFAVANRIPVTFERDHALLQVVRDYIVRKFPDQAEMVAGHIRFSSVHAIAMCVLADGYMEINNHGKAKSCLENIEIEFAKAAAFYNLFKIYLEAAEFALAEHLIEKINEPTGLLKARAKAEIYEAGQIFDKTYEKVEHPLKPEQREMFEKFKACIEEQKIEQASKIAEDLPFIYEKETAFSLLCSNALRNNNLPLATQYASRVTIDDLKEQTCHIMASSLASIGDMSKVFECEQISFFSENEAAHSNVAKLCLAAGNLKAALDRIADMGSSYARAQALLPVICDLTVDNRTDLAFDIAARAGLAKKDEFALMSHISKVLKEYRAAPHHASQKA